MASDLYAPAAKTPALTESAQVQKWMDRITVAKKVNEEHYKTSGNERFLKHYKGESTETVMRRAGPVKVPPVNLVFAYVQSDIASTYNRDPYITVNAKGGSTKGAKLKEVWLNAKWRELKIKEEIELEILDKDLFGGAWHKTGYAAESEGQGGNLRIKKEGVYSLRVANEDMFWNVGAMRPPSDCMWMAQRIIRPLEEVKAKYPNAAGLEGTVHPRLTADGYGDTIKNLTYKDDIKVAIFFEIWDSQTRQILLVADGLKDKYLDAPKAWPEGQEKFPFDYYWDFAVPGEPRPMSSIAPWEPQMLEFQFILAQAVSHVKRWNRQMLVRQGTIDQNALDKYERGDDGAVIEVNGTLDGGVQFVDYGQLPTDFYMIMDRLVALMNEINGQPAFDRGGVTKTNTRTIGELQQMKAGAKSRTDRKIDRLETHLENIARKMLAVMEATLDFEEAIKITGDTPEEVTDMLGDHFNKDTGMVTFSPEDIADETDVEVYAGSTLPLDKETRMSILEVVLQQIAAVAGQSPMSPLMVQVISQMLEQFGIKGLEEAYEMELRMAEERMRASNEKQGVDEAKSMADAEKRKAQAEQIQTQTKIMIREEEDRNIIDDVMDQVRSLP